MASDVFVERSTASPPLPAPNAPSNARIMATAPTSMTIAWEHNSSDEALFGIKYWNLATNAQGFVEAPANATTATVTGLASKTTYCFDVEAIGYFGTTAAPRVCGTTPLQGPSLAVTAITPTSRTGLRAEQIRNERGLARKDIDRPVLVALKMKRITKTGQRRGMRYFAG